MEMLTFSIEFMKIFVSQSSSDTSTLTSGGQRDDLNKKLHVDGEQILVLPPWSMRLREPHSLTFVKEWTQHWCEWFNGRDDGHIDGELLVIEETQTW